jgi:DNA-directed RNA polymerase I, II, and III subunit RPABC2
MSDYLDSTNDDLEEESILEEEEVDNLSEVEDDSFKPSKSMITRENVYDQIYHQPYTTTGVLTKYEKTRIIAVRAAMIADGMGSLVDPGDLTRPIDIARKELAENKLPLILRRPIPSRNHKKPNYEYRRVADLQK